MLLASTDAPPSAAGQVLAAAGFRITATALGDPIDTAVGTARADVVVVAYRVAERQRAWNLLTVLRADRRLRALPVVVVTDDAHQVEAMGDHLARLGIGVVLGAGDGALVSAVRARLAA